MHELDEEFISKLEVSFYDWVDAKNGWSLLTPELENIIRIKEWLNNDSEWGRYSDYYDYFPFELDLPEEPWWWGEFDGDEQGMFIDDLYYIG